MTMSFYIQILLLLIVGYHRVESVHVTDIVVPEVVDFRENVTISCSYNLSGYILNSVKWYKNSDEFFRYSPMLYPPINHFKLTGISLVSHLYNCDNTMCSIILSQLSAESTGVYLCEISGDAPAFKVAHKSAKMTVAVLPRNDPFIYGISTTKMYEFGDFIIANCTSDKSSPPAILTWYINEEKVTHDYLQPEQETSIATKLGFVLKYRSSEIRFHIDKSRYHKFDHLSLKCVATIEQFPHLIRERTKVIHIATMDRLTNQKLVRNVGASELAGTITIKSALCSFGFTFLWKLPNMFFI